MAVDGFRARRAAETEITIAAVAAGPVIPDGETTGRGAVPAADRVAIGAARVAEMARHLATRAMGVEPCGLTGSERLAGSSGSLVACGTN